jgi:hypothetical protein
MYRLVWQVFKYYKSVWICQCFGLYMGEICDPVTLGYDAQVCLWPIERQNLQLLQKVMLRLLPFNSICYVTLLD